MHNVLTGFKPFMGKLVPYCTPKKKNQSWEVHDTTGFEATMDLVAPNNYWWVFF
jgi:beta-lactamase class D